MEAVYAPGPIASYLEGRGTLDAELDSEHPLAHGENAAPSFAPPNTTKIIVPRRKRFLPPLHIPKPPLALRQIHDAWSTAVNSRIGRSDNARFLEHFRYVIVASQLLNEFLDQGALQPQQPLEIVDKHERERAGLAHAAISPVGVAVVALGAFACASLLHWVRVSGLISRKRAVLVFTIYTILAVIGYAYCRKQWLRYVRRRAIENASNLTTSWQSFEVSSSSAISLVQEVELVSKGYRLSTPLPPISRVEENSATRRCARLRKTLHTAYDGVITTCTTAVSVLRDHINEEDLDKYYEIYDVSSQDISDALRADALTVIDDDAESLKSLRVLSFRAGILRRALLCHLMSLPADGGKPDMKRWRRGVEAMSALAHEISTASEKINNVLNDMETLVVPTTPAHKPTHITHTREKMRSQVRKIATLSTGIRSLQAKMQILREETNRSIEKSDDLTDLGPDLMAQYESIGADIKDLMEAWELGKASLQTNITKQERRISMASSGLRSPVSSIGGLTAVEEDGSPADALRALTGDLSDTSKRSSMATSSPSEEEIFEAVAVPRQRSSLTREERIAKIQEERERQATIRATRDANSSMLKELESVINLRPRKLPGEQRVLSI